MKFVLEADGETTWVGVQDALGDTPVLPHLFANSEVAVTVSHWLEHLSPGERNKALTGWFMEHQLSAVVSTKTEEEHIANLNVTETEDLINILIHATRVASSRNEGNHKLHVEVRDIYAVLERQNGLLLPGYVVYVFLKTWEHFNGGVWDIGEGFFTLVEPEGGQKKDEPLS